MKENLLIGICGSVGACSIVNYISILSDYFNIRLIFTEHSLYFVQPDGFKSLIDAYYDSEFSTMDPLHITLSTWADFFIILPASANVIGKMANGIADDLLTSTLLAYDKKVYIAANMNPRMWDNPVLKKNVKCLKEIGHQFINEGRIAKEAATGERVYSEACMPSVEKILHSLGISLIEEKTKK